MPLRSLLPFVVVIFPLAWPAYGSSAELRGRIVDAVSREALPARVYLQSEAGKWFHLETTASDGSAVRYDKQRDTSVEVHTTLSAHPFEVGLPAGRYTLTVERGKEYHPVVRRFEIGDADLKLEVPLRRWTDMAKQGWYSGDTHVHRTLSELPNVLLAEDLNVALPLTYWVTDSEESPSTANKNPEAVPQPRLVEVDDSHVIWPINTEYEIFTVRGRRHTLGALFFLNHRLPLEHKTPPVGLSVQQAQRQGRRVLLDLDKHNWPWSMMLVPTAGVNLFELSNNHIWRSEFLFAQWYPEHAADYMQLEMTSEGHFTERGWIDFGFKNYYALLNCGFNMLPSAGTASGVHPVPLGFGRVYVLQPEGFDYDRWIDGLAAGRSFVTTGPMLTASFNGNPLGTRFETEGPLILAISGTAASANPLESIEVIVNGDVVERLAATNERTEADAYRSQFQTELRVSHSSWVALKCFERRPDNRPRFAHTAPVHIKVDDQPLEARVHEVEYLANRVQNEIDRHRNVLSDQALAEYQAALKRFQALLE